MNNTNKPSLLRQYLSFLGLILFSTLVVVFVVLLVFYFEMEGYIITLFDWLSGLGMLALIIFIVIDALVVLLLLPGLAFTLGAGFLFGFIQGVVIILLGTTLGASFAFLLARYFLNEKFKAFLRRNKKFHYFDRELLVEGWRVILMTRLIPFFPFKVSNYFFGIANFRFIDFVIGTFIGIIPITVFNVYLGAIAGDINRILHPDHIIKSPYTLWFYGLGFVFLVIALSYFSHLSKRAMDKYLAQSGDISQGKHSHE